MFLKKYKQFFPSRFFQFFLFFELGSPWTHYSSYLLLLITVEAEYLPWLVIGINHVLLDPPVHSFRSIGTVSLKTWAWERPTTGRGTVFLCSKQSLQELHTFSSEERFIWVSISTSLKRFFRRLNEAWLNWQCNFRSIFPFHGQSNHQKSYTEQCLPLCFHK